MKKKEFKLFNKIRSALRLIYSRSPMRREAIKAVAFKQIDGTRAFRCAMCNTWYPIQLADVDHQPPCGQLASWDDLVPFAKRLFEGSVQVIDKHICHKKKTKEQRKRK